MTPDQLKTQFGDCKFTARSGCSNKSPYEQLSNEIFYVSDPGCYDANNKQPCKIVHDDEKSELTVKNTLKTEICFVKTDKCLLSDQESKCDCILFNERMIFLVEIKNTNSGGRGEKRNTAIRQLGATIELLRSNGISFENFDAKAIICFKTRNNRPVETATTSKQIEFLEKYSVILEERNTIEF